MSNLFGRIENPSIDEDFCRYGLELDFWTVGVLLYEMVMGEAPFEGEDDGELYGNILTADIYIDPTISKGARTCILGVSPLL